MSEKKYTIESMTTNGPDIHDYSIEDAVKKLNQEKANKRMIFIDGIPIQDDLITQETVEKCKTNISVVNELIGG